MATMDEIGESEISDDTISLTSTVKSSEPEDPVYEVDRIMAEKPTENGKTYFIKWKGYPLYRSTWEPSYAVNYECETAWFRRKTQIKKGEVEPDDIEAVQREIDEYEVEYQARKEQRAAKRRRLGVQFKGESEEENIGNEEEVANKEDTANEEDVPFEEDIANEEDMPKEKESPFECLSRVSSIESAIKPVVKPAVELAVESEQQSFKWTPKQIITLEKALQESNGSDWIQILSWYGTNGSRSEVLSGKHPSDLRLKAEDFRRGFVDAGKEPPLWLLLKRPKAVEDQRAALSTELPGSSLTRESSVDLLMEELRLRSKHREMKMATKPSSGSPNRNTTSQRCDRKDVATILEANEQPLRKTKVAYEEDGDSDSPHQRDPRKIGSFKDLPASGMPIGSTRRLKPGLSTSEIISRDTPIESLEASVNAYQRKTVVPTNEDDNESPILERDPRKTGGSKSIPASKTPFEVTSHLETGLSASEKISSGATFEVSKAASTQMERVSTSNSDPQKMPSDSNPVHEEPVLAARAPSRAQALPEATSSIVLPRFMQTSRRRSDLDVFMTPRKTTKRRESNISQQSGKQLGKTFKNLAMQNAVQKRARNEPAPNPKDLDLFDPRTKKTPSQLPFDVGGRDEQNVPLDDQASSGPEHESVGISNDAMDIDETEGPATRENDLQKITENALRKASTKPKTVDMNYEDMELDETEKATTSGNDLHKITKDALREASTKNKPVDILPESRRYQPDHDAASTADNLKATSSVQLGCARGSGVHFPKTQEEIVKLISVGLRQSTDPRRLSPSLNTRSTKHFSLLGEPVPCKKEELFGLKDDNMILGHIKIGSENSAGNLLKVKFMGLNLQVHRRFLKIKIPPTTMHFDFRQTCLAFEYMKYFSARRLLGSGYISPYVQATGLVEQLARTLAGSLRGCICFTQYFTMILYPVQSSVWNFLDQNLPEVSSHAWLRFAVCEPLHEDPTRKLASLHPGTTDLQLTQDLKNNSTINIVFEDMLGIKYDKLLAPNNFGDNTAQNLFFLCFIPQGAEQYEGDMARRSALRKGTSEEHDLFVDFLKANKASEIFSMSDIGSIEVAENGAWNYFLENAKRGTIIFHDACIRQDKLPKLASLLRNGDINVWKISHVPMPERQLHLVRLFPHGGAILLTVSLILYQPRETLRIVKWFRRVQLPSKPRGTWKLMMRPRVREWLLDLLDVFSHGKQVVADIYKEILWLLEDPEHPTIYKVLDGDPEMPAEDAPLVTPANLKASAKEWNEDGRSLNHETIKRNDDALIQCFAEWGMVHLESFRRYNAVLGYRNGLSNRHIKEYERWGHVEMMKAEDCFRRYKIAVEEVLDMVDDPRCKLKEGR